MYAKLQKRSTLAPLSLAVGDELGAYLEFGDAREGSWRTTSEGIRPVGPQSLLMAGMS